MSDTVLSIENCIKTNRPHRPAFFNPAILPWSDRVMPGTYFKLLNINELTGGVIMFAVVHGPLLGYNEDGSIAAVIDGRFMYDLASQNKAVDHIVVTNIFSNDD